MREDLLEVAVHSLLLGVYAIAALVAGIAGLVIEYHSYLYFLAGDYRMGAWIALFGGVALIFAYLFITDKVAPALRPN